jgi:hypothetical protein
MLRLLIFVVVVGAMLFEQLPAGAAPPEFPPLGSAQSVQGELMAADFIHRSGKFRTADGELMSFTMPPYAIVTYRGTESDLRDVPLGTEMEFLLLADDDGRLTRLVGTRQGSLKQGPAKQGGLENNHADKIGTADEALRKRFIEFTRARGLAGWIDETAGKTLTVTFFSGNPELFAATWDADFAEGSDVTVCVANDELRTWQPTSCGERGTVVDTRSVPIEGYGSSGRQVVIRVNNMLEGFRGGRVVRVFGSGWKVRNQLYQECLINYGYSARPAADFRENLAKHYPEHFPYRTDHGNRHLPWFQAQEGSPPPLYSEHLMTGDLTAVDSAGQGGEFKCETTGETVKFTLLATGARRSAIQYLSESNEGGRTRLADLPLGRRYRFQMYQDAGGAFTRCSSISDEYSHAALNGLNYRITALDLAGGRMEVDWQGVPVQNYQKEMETPPPLGRSVLRLAPETRVWKSGAEISPTGLKVGDLIKISLTSELPGRPSNCPEVWIVENSGGRGKKKR